VWEEVGRPVPSNETSLVVRLNEQLLLTGDASEMATGRMLRRGWDLRAAVLAAPHHGKWNEHLPGLFAQTRATILLVSASEGYYSRKTIEAFPGAVFVTDRDGAIEATLSDPPRVRTFLGKGARDE
jgi:beta-lactamase superfamily II metal-dependent hydrolase